MLNAFQVKNAKPRESSYKISDGNGLFLHVAPSGNKTWRYRFKINSKESTFVIGSFPAISLEAARTARADLRELIRGGTNPALTRKAEKKEEPTKEKEDRKTFSAVARAWSEKHAPSISERHGKRIAGYLNKVLCPALGDKPVQTIKPGHVYGVVSRYEKEGKPATAHKLLHVCRQVLEFARLTGLCQYNAASGLAKALRPVESSHRAALAHPEDLGRLLQDIETLSGHISTKYFLKIMPYVFTRSSELRLARWREIDFENGLWRIPGTRMKMGRDEIVPLAGQVVRCFQDLKNHDSHSEFIFPGRASGPISAHTPLKALRRLGYDQRTMSIHGFRAIASSLLNEQGYRPDWIERQLAHGEKNTVRAAYNRAEYLAERKQMMQDWADYLDGLRADAQNEKKGASGNVHIKSYD